MTNVAPQIGTKYTLTNGTVRVTFNDPLDADNVGMLTNVVGTDSPEVREDGEAFVQSDGGVHGPFLYGRRPITLEGFTYGHVSDAHRNERIGRLMQATDAMAGNATLSWQPLGGPLVAIQVRRQQPLKITGGWNKTFQISLVAADPRFYIPTPNTVTKTTTASSVITNAGNTETFPTYTLYGGTSAAPNIKRDSTNLVAFSRSVDLDRVLVIDSLNRSVSGLRRRVNWFRNPSFEHATISHVSTTTQDRFGIPATGSPTVDAFAAQPSPGSGFGTKVLKLTTTGVGATPFPSSTGGEKIATFIPKGEGYASATNTYVMPPEYTNMYIVVGFNVARASASAGYVPYVQVIWLEDNPGGMEATTQSGQWWGSLPITTAWQRIAAAIPIAPHRAGLYAEVQIGVQNSANQATGQIYYFDDVTIEIVPNSSSSAGFYPDGVTSGWEGTTNDSRSYVFAPDTTMWPATSDYKLLDFASTTWGGLLPGSNNISLNGAFTTGGSLKVDWSDAWL